jgi:HD superfamily phosphohydrolase
LPAYHAFLKFAKTIKLPEYDYIGITELERSIIDTRYFQRLRYIRQSPGVSMVFPGASHSRFEHSLGAMHIAGETAMHILLNERTRSTKSEEHLPIIEYFKDGDTRITRLVQIARLAALLHDLGHGPFSHTFEKFLKLCDAEKTWKHEELSLEIIYKKLKDKFENAESNPYKIDVKEVMSLLCDIKRPTDRSQEFKITLTSNMKEFLTKQLGFKAEDITFIEHFLTENWFLNDIIKGEPYNVDRFNYLILDSNRSGATEYGAIDFQRLIQNLYINHNVVMVSTKAEDAAVRFFEAYTHMYRSVYQHKSSYAADLHLAYTMFLACQEELENNIFRSLRDNHDMERMLTLTDDVLLYNLVQMRDKVKSDLCRRMIDDYLSRNILTMVEEIDGKNRTFKNAIFNGGVDELAKKIRKEAGMKEEEFLRIEDIHEKRPTTTKPTEFLSDMLNGIKFLNLKTDTVKEVDKRIVEYLTEKEAYRIYITKDDTLKSRVQEKISALVG